MSTKIPAGLQGPVRQQSFQEFFGESLQEQFPLARVAAEGGGIALTRDRRTHTEHLFFGPAPLPEGWLLLFEFAEKLRDTLEEAGLEGEVTLGKLRFPTE